jgi:signal transduction histidine kinase
VTAVTAVTTTGSATEVDRQQQRVFPLFLFSSLIITAGLTLVAEGFTRRTIAGLVVSTVILGLYIAIGHRALCFQDERLGQTYLALVVPLAIALFFLSTIYLSALFGLFPLCFALVDRWLMRSLAAGGLAVGVVISNAADNEWSQEGWIAGFVIGVVSFAFAVIMGRWITSIIHTSKARQSLIDELQATRSQLAAAQHESGVRAERERLAAEIHDTLAQGFSSILLLTRSAQQHVVSDPARAATLLSSVEQAAQANLNEARALVQSLAPVALQHASLGDALARLIEQLRAETGIDAILSVTGSAADAELTPAEDVVLLRAVQESLTNVRRHANATRVQVILRYDDNPVSASVSDNGVGFDAATKLNGHGLSGMQSRLGSVGGRVAIDASPGGGCTVTTHLAARDQSL